MGRMPSVVKQVTELINGEIDCRGESKYEAKQGAIAEIRAQDGTATSNEINSRIGIFSNSAARHAHGTWVDMAKYIKEEFGIKNIYDTRPEHVADYLNYRLEKGDLTVRSFNNICGYAEKYGVALRMESGDTTGRYSFHGAVEPCRQDGKISLPANEVANRKYDNPAQVSGAMASPIHTVAAELMYQGGARISEVSELRADRNMLGINADGMGEIKLTNTKNGQERTMYTPAANYKAVEAIQAENGGVFRFDQSEFRTDLIRACEATGEQYTGAHAFRYNFAQSEFQKNLDKGMSVAEAKQAVAEKMGHTRADKDTTDRYLGRA